MRSLTKYESNGRAEEVKALYFSAKSKPLLHVGGAGGLQYLSEAIAAQDSGLLEAIDERTDGALIGIFALGGGTGSGSLFSVLKYFKDKIARYTIGVGILPSRDNTQEFVNAGRYLTKFLGALPSERFNTLLLFSNDLAEDVLIGSDLDSKEDPKAIINGYISAFVHDFSLINDRRTTSLFGKLFDPMDGKRYLSGVATVGYASDAYSVDGNYSAEKLFLNAISPMNYEHGRINGVAVQVTPVEVDDEAEGEDQVAPPSDGWSIDPAGRKRMTVTNVLKALVERLKAGDQAGARAMGRELEGLTPFYRSVKSVRVFTS